MEQGQFFTEYCSVHVGGISPWNGGSLSLNIALSMWEAIHHGMGAVFHGTLLSYQKRLQNHNVLT